jgi:hypothetical protein
MNRQKQSSIAEQKRDTSGAKHEQTEAEKNCRKEKKW